MIDRASGNADQRIKAGGCDEHRAAQPLAPRGGNTARRGDAGLEHLVVFVFVPSGTGDAVVRGGRPSGALCVCPSRAVCVGDWAVPRIGAAGFELRASSFGSGTRGGNSGSSPGDVNGGNAG